MYGYYIKLHLHRKELLRETSKGKLDSKMQSQVLLDIIQLCFVEQRQHKTEIPYLYYKRSAIIQARFLGDLKEEEEEEGNHQFSQIF